MTNKFSSISTADLVLPAQAAATSVWAAVVADKDEIGGRYLEEYAVPPIDDTPSPFPNEIRTYVLDTNNPQIPWAKSEEMVRKW